MSVRAAVISARFCPSCRQVRSAWADVPGHRLSIGCRPARNRIARTLSAQQFRQESASTATLPPEPTPADQPQPEGFGAAAKRSAMSVGGYATWLIAMALSLHIWAYGLGLIVWHLVKKCVPHRRPTPRHHQRLAIPLLPQIITWRHALMPADAGWRVGSIAWAVKLCVRRCLKTSC